MGTGSAASQRGNSAEDLSNAVEHWLKRAMLTIAAVFVAYFAALFFVAR